MHTFSVPMTVFPGLSGGWARRRPAYLDNACLTPTPAPVAKAVAAFYRRAPACLLRSPTRRANALDLDVREARERVRRLVGAQFSDEIVFTPNTTLGINLLASAFQSRPGRVLLSDAEHNSNRLPWLPQGIAELAWPPGTSFPLDAYRALLRDDVKLVSLASVSNFTGARLPVGDVVREAHARGIPVHLDAAQQVVLRDLDVSEDEPDFVSFSFHKAYGPSGLGALYLRRQWQRELKPLISGGGSVDDHHEQDSVAAAGPARFEFGLQNYAAQVAVPACVDFLERFGAPTVAAHFQRLARLARELLGATPGVTFLGGDLAADAAHVLSFFVEGVDPARVAELLDQVGDVQVRAGRMCAHHYFHRYDLPPCLRVSFGYQTTEKEVRRLVRVLHAVLRYYVPGAPDAG